MCHGIDWEHQARGHSEVGAHIKELKSAIAQIQPHVKVTKHKTAQNKVHFKHTIQILIKLPNVLVKLCSSQLISQPENRDANKLQNAVTAISTSKRQYTSCIVKLVKQTNTYDKFT
jgi:ABC-type uncharacterized transport system auxiliary subunit